MASERVPCVHLLVPGPWASDAPLLEQLRRAGVGAAAAGQDPHAEVSVQWIQDDRLVDALGWSRHGPLAADALAQVAQCHAAAVVEIRLRLDQAAERVAQIGRALAQAGGVALRVEGSGTAWTWQAWLDRLDSGLPEHLVEAAVSLVQDTDGTVFTCGMQHFDLPDAQLRADDAAQAVAWLECFNSFQLGESPVLVSGQTFRPGPDHARRVLERWPDGRHDSTDGRHNPFGIWRFLEPGVPGLAAPALTPVPIPSLVATLAALERKNGGPLSRAQVRALVDQSPVIAMERADAIALEKRRGYADVEPELAWAQWQIVRARL